MARPLRVVVVDDSAVLRTLLVGYVASEPGLEVVRTFVDAESLLAAVHDTRPDVVILDNEMPGRHGIDVLPELVRLLPAARVVMWSADPSAAALAVARGASCFLDKGAGLDLVVAAALGGPCLSAAPDPSPRR